MSRSFAIGVKPSGAVAALSKRNGGWITFTAVGISGRHFGVTTFSNRWNGSGWVMAPSISLRLDGSVQGAGKGLPEACGDYYIVSTSANYWTDIGEKHSTTNMSGTFTYGQTADSDLGVGVSYDFGSSWSASGTVHIGETESTSNTWTIGYDEGNRLRTQFHYEWRDYYLTYPCSGYWFSQSIATDWVTGALVGSDIHNLDYQCNTQHAQYRSLLGSGASFDRSLNDFVTFSGAFTLWGAFTGTSQSGASSFVKLHLHSDSSTHSYCGTDAYPPSSHRIYAGDQH